MRNLALSLVFLACARLHAQRPDLLTNFQYAVSRGVVDPADRAKIVPAPLDGGHDLRIQEGTEVLLKECLDHPDEWAQDPLIFRLAHKHAATNIGCRERANPSMHVVFYEQPNGTRQAWIHFDLYGPGNRGGHTLELVRNRLTFSYTEQPVLHRSLMRRFDDPALADYPPDYNLKDHFKRYLKDTYSPLALADSVATGSLRALIGDSGVHELGIEGSGFGTGGDSFLNHIEANLARHAIQETIEYGTGALLRQDESFSTLGPGAPFKQRVSAALYHAFIVDAPDRAELAFPRIAAAYGTAWVDEQWHPWDHRRRDPWVGGSVILSHYVARSFWTEFKPDVKTMSRRALHRP